MINMKCLKQLLTGIVIMCYAVAAYGQGWEKNYSKITPDQGTLFGRVNTVKQTTDGGFISSGEGLLASGSIAGFLLRVDPNGDTLWQKIIQQTPLLPYYAHSSIQEINNNEFISIGTPYNLLGGSTDLISFDGNGDIIWRKPIPIVVNPNVECLKQTIDGGYIVVGEKPNNTTAKDCYILKTDINGDTLWSKTYDGGGYEIGNAVIQTTGGGYIVVGKTTGLHGTGNNDDKGLVLKLDANGTIIWTRVIDLTTNTFLSVAPALNGGYILSGIANDSANLTHIDTNGYLNWTQNYHQGDIYAAKSTTDTNYITIGAKWDGVKFNISLMKTDSLGNSIWQRIFASTSSSLGLDVNETTDQGFILSGQLPLPSGIFSPFLARTNSLGHTLTNTLSGQVVYDQNSDCVLDASDPQLSNLLIKATNVSMRSFYATTDSLGMYTMLVDTGIYTISIVSPLNYYTSLCQNNPTTTIINNFYEKDTVDFLLEAEILCPLLEVDLSAPLIRQTIGSNYVVSYCNIGTDTAHNAYVEVELDPNLTVLGSSAPIVSQNANVYTFNLGDIAIGNCDNFIITVRANSATVLGQTICSEAHIYPDSICSDSLWNGPVLDVNASCSNDTVTFTIKNVGAAMTQGSQYFVYEDDIIFRTGTTNALPMNGTEEIKVYAGNGMTYRIEAEQLTGLPAMVGDSTATGVVESCNLFSNGLFNMGFVTSLSNGYSSPFLAIDCQPLVASYDPNDKSAQPEGYGTPHYIYNYTPLDYKVRFQNTGTDTAFRVVIRDTLSAYLDVATIEMGASSHNYTWRVYGSGILEITFDNIMLPDSNVNEPASNGFVRFRINQVPNNVDGTVIYNDAAIYFDYNAPIITNETYHTIGSNFVTMLVTGTEKILVDKAIEVKVYPNPFHEQATLEVVGGNYQELTLKVYDVMGREAMHNISKGDQKIQIERNNLLQGVYIYQLVGDGELINTGKIIID